MAGVAARIADARRNGRNVGGLVSRVRRGVITSVVLTTVPDTTSWAMRFAGVLWTVWTCRGRESGMTVLTVVVTPGSSGPGRRTNRVGGTTCRCRPASGTYAVVVVLLPGIRTGGRLATWTRAATCRGLAARGTY